ncbi:MAG: 3',5'-cyclic nucleotide phosphodiesterase [Candidatus Moranbacteria bacterium]|nr:3',5'-cyclic nucleotide phosphodiesterase [Candidatus Moranbacteria bacterium]
MDIPVCGSTARIVRNDDGLYEGNLRYYFRYLFNQAKNLGLPYHNFQHMIHVMVMCHAACMYYRDRLTPRQIRNILIAAMLHDLDHSGMPGHDDLNIERAIRGLESCLLPEDKDHAADIFAILRATQFPHVGSSESLPLQMRIIRDADLTQSFSYVWIQSNIFGLSREHGISPIEMLHRQIPFLEGIEFHTEWAKTNYPRSVIESKIAEVRDLLELLEYNPTSI